MDLDAKLDAIGAQRFRAKFHLAKRLAAALPVNDGRQTPYRGHPVFVAQHATGTCCRSCLRKNHGIDKDVALTDAQVEYVVGVICRWIERELS